MKSVALVFLGDYYYDARCINMADFFINNGYSVYIYNVSSSSKNYRGHSVININLGSFTLGFIKYFIFFNRARKELFKRNFDIIIASDLYSLPAAIMNSKSKIIYDSREIYSHLGSLSKKPIKQKFWQILESFCIKKVSLVLVNAKTDEQFLKIRYPFIFTKLIYNFPSLKLQPPKNKILYETFNIPEKFDIFLYQGVLLNGRGINLMIETLLTFENAHVVLIGIGPFRENAEKFAKKINVYDRVHFLGKVPYRELLSYTASATIGFSLIEPISLSYKNALPNKIFEYALSGIPTIATDLHEIKHFFEKYDLGVLVSLNKEKIILGIKEILKNEYSCLQSISQQALVWENQLDLLEILDEN